MLPVAAVRALSLKGYISPESIPAHEHAGKMGALELSFSTLWKAAQSASRHERARICLINVLNKGRIAQHCCTSKTLNGR